MTGPLVHSPGLATEHAALAKVRPKIRSMRQRILADLEAAGDHGLTPDEWQEQNGGLINTVRRRFTDMWKDGLIRHHQRGISRRNMAGNECTVWVRGRDYGLTILPRGAQVAALLRKIKALESENAVLRARLKTQENWSDHDSRS